MHLGYGYSQNYHDNYNIPDLIEDLSKSYAPIFIENKANLYIARQGKPRNSNEEKELLDHPAVHGLVFSFFRFDNPAVIKRDDRRV